MRGWVAADPAVRASIADMALRANPPLAPPCEGGVERACSCPAILLPDGG
jgi:hypothetical protein